MRRPQHRAVVRGGRVKEREGESVCLVIVLWAVWAVCCVLRGCVDVCVRWMCGPRLFGVSKISSILGSTSRLSGSKGQKGSGWFLGSEVVLGRFWGGSGMVLGRFWGGSGVVLGRFWGGSGAVLGWF